MSLVEHCAHAKIKQHNYQYEKESSKENGKEDNEETSIVFFQKSCSNAGFFVFIRSVPI